RYARSAAVGAAFSGTWWPLERSRTRSVVILSRLLAPVADSRVLPPGDRRRAPKFPCWTAPDNGPTVRPRANATGEGHRHGRDAVQERAHHRRLGRGALRWRGAGPGQPYQGDRAAPGDAQRRAGCPSGRWRRRLPDAGP